MHESFPTRPITAETGPAWEIIFRDVSDREFLGACLAACRESGRTFFPTPGELSALILPPPAQYDTEAVLRRVRETCEYVPGYGYSAPRVVKVRELLGDVIANALSEVGAARLYSDNATTREIAAREFAEALTHHSDAERRGKLIAPHKPALETAQRLRLAP